MCTHLHRLKYGVEAEDQSIDKSLVMKADQLRRCVTSAVIPHRQTDTHTHIHTHTHTQHAHTRIKMSSCSWTNAQHVRTRYTFLPAPGQMHNTIYASQQISDVTWYKSLMLCYTYLMLHTHLLFSHLHMCMYVCFLTNTRLLVSFIDYQIVVSAMNGREHTHAHTHIYISMCTCTYLCTTCTYLCTPVHLHTSVSCSRCQVCNHTYIHIRIIYV
jgi:hypothetical protein